MAKNVGSADGIIRTIIATTTGLLYFLGILRGTFGIVACLAAVILALSSFFRFCPLYYLFGLSTYHLKN